MRPRTTTSVPSPIALADRRRQIVSGTRQRLLLSLSLQLLFVESSFLFRSGSILTTRLYCIMVFPVFLHVTYIICLFLLSSTSSTHFSSVSVYVCFSSLLSLLHKFTSVSVYVCLCSFSFLYIVNILN